MKCSLHETREAGGMCVTCGKAFCEECLVTLEGRFYCKKHVADIFKSNVKTEGNSFENQHVQDNINIHNEIYNHNETQRTSNKSRTITFLLCLFFGYMGIHRIYVGKIGTGILYFLTGGFFGIGWFIDIVLVGTGRFSDSHGNRIK